MSASASSLSSPVRVLANAVTVLAIAAILAAGFVLHHAWMLQNHDMEWLLIAAQRWLDGGRYVTDFDEITPPLILPLIAPAVILAARTGLDLWDSYLAWVSALILLSAWLARPSLRFCLNGAPLAYRVALVAYAAIFALEPGYEFGQREHLLAILAVPGLLWFGVREAGGNARMTAGSALTVAVAIGALLIKPYYLIIAPALLAMRAVRLRRWQVLWDPVIGIGIVVVGLYAVMVLAAFPEYLTEARLQSPIYFAWNRPWLTILDDGRDSFTVLAVALALTGLLAATRSRLAPVLGTLCIASVCSLVVVFWQKKGWPYHFQPALEMALTGVMIAGVAHLSRLRSAAGGAVVAAVAMVAILVLLRPVNEATGITRARYATRPLIQALQQQAAGKSVMLLTGGMQMGFPMLAGVSVGARHPGQPLLAGTVVLAEGNAQQRADAARLRQVLMAQAVRDIRHWRPDIIAVDVRTDRQGMAADFDILAYYMADPAFAAEWARYRRVPGATGWDFYARIESP